MGSVARSGMKAPSTFTSWLPLPRSPAASHVSTISKSPRGNRKARSEEPPPSAGTPTWCVCTSVQVALWQPLPKDPWHQSRQPPSTGRARASCSPGPTPAQVSTRQSS